jgi:hypothetical protein
MATHVFGIRHHGPGSARSLIRALDELRPDVLLIEGPPDAADVLAFAADLGMEPPVALLIYLPEQPRRAVFYPFARFSPEWQAMQWSFANGVPVRFMDLPQAHQLSAGEEEEVALPSRREDPLRLLAEAAGEADGERWWERMVEHRQNSTDLFSAVLEAMSELRAQTVSDPDPREQRRESWMRQTIRSAEKENFERIAVVCGAWHAPVLVDRPAAKDDAAVLKGLPKAKVAATWVPWTYGRLQFASGYGAGIESPGWYDHLWQHPERVAVRWLSRVARLLREQDLDASPAHVIETLRLAEALSAMRGSAFTGLCEFQEAVEAVMLFGNPAPLRLIHQKLVVGERLGHVPDATPSIPLQRDLQGHQKRLRLAPEAGQRVLDLDLRKPGDLERSHLLHRLCILDIAWGVMERVAGKSGTFHEVWRLQWQPEFSVGIIAASFWGNTLEEASAAKMRDAGTKAGSLPELTTLVESALLASLPSALPSLLQRLDSESAVAADLAHLMQALPALVRVQRYGDVRQTDTAHVGIVVRGMITRIAIGLPIACASLDDAAAALMLRNIDGVHEAIGLVREEASATQWQVALRQIGQQHGVHGLVAGRANRLLLDRGDIGADEGARRFSLALSLVGDPVQAASWAEGFLKGSGLLLLHDDKLWAIVDQWVSSLKVDTFTELLPLLARTFSSFAAAERRQMGERVRAGQSQAVVQQAPVGFDQARADAVLPLLARIFGLGDAE